MNPTATHRTLATGAVALALALTAGTAVAQKGDTARDRTQDRTQTRDPAQDRDQDRLRIHQDADAAQDRLQTRLREMDQLRTQLRDTDRTRTRERDQLRAQYREQVRLGFDDLLAAGAGPGPKATDKQRLQHMERNMFQMQQVLRHAWEVEEPEEPVTE